MADDLLSQDEIDALVHGVDVGSVDVAALPGKDDASRFDFATQTRIVRGRMPTLEMVNERFARLFRISLFNTLRRSPEIAVAPVRTQKFGDYVQTLHVPTSLNLVRISPLRGTALVLLDPKLVFSVIDNYFGGNGRFAKIEGREFTATEMQIVRMLLDHAFANLQEAWKPVTDISVEYLNSEMNPHFAKFVGPTEIVVVTSFHIELDGGGGDLHVTMPYSMLEPLKEILEAGIHGDRQEQDGRWANLLADQIEEAEVELVTVFGRTSITLGEMGKLRPGVVLPCDFNGEVVAYVEGVPMIRGALCDQRGRKVIKVHERLQRKTENSLLGRRGDGL